MYTRLHAGEGAGVGRGGAQAEEHGADGIGAKVPAAVGLLGGPFREGEMQVGHLRSVAKCPSSAVNA